MHFVASLIVVCLAISANGEAQYPGTIVYPQYQPVAVPAFRQAVPATQQTAAAPPAGGLGGLAQFLGPLLGLGGANFNNMPLSGNAQSMLTTFNAESLPALQRVTDQSSTYLATLTDASLPMLRELSVAAEGMMKKYTEELRVYNTEGGVFPEPPKQLTPFFGLSQANFPVPNQAPAQY